MQVYTYMYNISASYSVHIQFEDLNSNFSVTQINLVFIILVLEYLIFKSFLRFK